MAFPIILTPKEEVQCYADLPVTLEEKVYRVAVTKYRCANTSFGKDAAHGGTQEAVVFKDKLLQASKKGVLGDLSAVGYVGVFVGKGSRRNIITVLEWVDKCKLLDPKLSKQAGLQKICDDYIGLDCNGYVGNWADENCVPTIGPSTPPTGMGGVFRKNKRMSLDEIQPYDIIVWDVHVAAVESIGPVVGSKSGSHRVAMVGESYGAIMCKERIITVAAPPNKFHVGGHDFGSAEIFGVGLSS